MVIVEFSVQFFTTTHVFNFRRFLKTFSALVSLLRLGVSSNQNLSSEFVSKLTSEKAMRAQTTQDHRTYSARPLVDAEINNF